MKLPTIPIILALLIPAAHSWAAPNDLDDLLRGGGIIVDRQPNQGGVSFGHLICWSDLATCRG